MIDTMSFGYGLVFASVLIYLIPEAMLWFTPAEHEEVRGLRSMAQIIVSIVAIALLIEAAFTTGLIGSG